MKIVMLLLALHVYAIANAQVSCIGSFTGQVLDQGNQPAVGATVFLLLDKNAGTSADSLGNFTFNDICPGTYTIKVQSLGYKSIQFELYIEGNVTRVIRLNENIKELNEVVVHEHLLHTEHALNYTVINEKQLAETAGKSLGESLKEIPGVNSIQTGPGIFKPVIHGVHSQRILILNYGIRQEGQQWGAEHAPEIDPFIASNIIVIKDASAIKYGTDALGGVIVVNPPPLPEKSELGGTFNSILQSNGRSGTISGMLEGGIKKHDGWGWRVQGTSKRTGDYQTPDYVLTNTGVKELNYSVTTGYHKKSKGFDVFFSHFKTELGILKGTSIESLDDLDSAMNRKTPQYTTGFGYSISEPKQEVSHNLLKINGHSKTKSGDWRLQYGFQNNNRKEFDFRVGASRGTPAIDLKLNTHTFESEWETKHDDNFSFCVGVSAMLQQNENIYGTKNIPFIPNFSSTSTGLFSVTKFTLGKWLVDLGVRYDYRQYKVSGRDFKNLLYHADMHFNNPSATAGATLQMAHNQTLNINLSSAWRPPHAAELYSFGKHQNAVANEYGLLLNDSTSEVRNINDVSFKTENALKLVTTYQHRWNTFEIELSPYANYIFNYIYLRPIGLTRTIRGTLPAFKYTQTNALFLGVDISGNWQASDHIKITPKASLLRASDEKENDYLIYIPSNRFEVAIRYEKSALLSFHNFYVESKTKYIAKQYRAPRVISTAQLKEASANDENIFKNDHSIFDFMAAPKGYFLWNLSTGISIKSKKTQYDFRLSSENTLNTSYREYTNRFRYYANDLGRNIILSIKCIF